MDLNNNNYTILNQIKKYLTDQMRPYESIIEFCTSKIYFALQDEEFKPANIEGYLCLIINRELQCLYLRVINTMDYSRLLEIELYQEIKSGYSVLHDNFHSIEFNFGYLGISFLNKTDGDRLKSAIFYISTIIYESNSKSCMVSKNQVKVKRRTMPVQEETQVNNLLKKIDEFEIREFSKVESNIIYEIDLGNKEIVYKIKPIPNQAKNDIIFESHYNNLKISFFGKDGVQENLKKVLKEDKKLAFQEFDTSKRKTIHLSKDNTESMTRVGRCAPNTNNNNASDNKDNYQLDSPNTRRSNKKLAQIQVILFI